MMRRTLYITAIVLLMLMTLASSKAVASVDDILTAHGRRSAPLNTLPQWQRIVEDYAFQRQFPAAGKTKALNKFVDSIRNDSRVSQILKVNLWFNGYPYKQDDWIYGEPDHWATPSEFLEHGGDCEDFVIIKYLTLRQLGFEAKDMRIAMVYDVFSGTDHSLLMVEYNGEDFVLDNRDNMTTAAHYTDRYKPHYMFNEEKLWTYDSPLIARGNTPKNVPLPPVLPGNR